MLGLLKLVCGKVLGPTMCAPTTLIVAGGRKLNLAGMDGVAVVIWTGAACASTFGSVFVVFSLMGIWGDFCPEVCYRGVARLRQSVPLVCC